MQLTFCLESPVPIVSTHAAACRCSPSLIRPRVDRRPVDSRYRLELQSYITIKKNKIIYMACICRYSNRSQFAISLLDDPYLPFCFAPAPLLPSTFIRSFHPAIGRPMQDPCTLQSIVGDTYYRVDVSGTDSCLFDAIDK